MVQPHDSAVYNTLKTDLTQNLMKHGRMNSWGSAWITGEDMYKKIKSIFSIDEGNRSYLFFKSLQK